MSEASFFMHVKGRPSGEVLRDALMCVLKDNYYDVLYIGERSALEH